MDRYSHVLGGLLGVACGDALGGTLEFLSEAEGRIRYGYLKDIIGGGCWDLEPGEVTDDTMMTIAVAEGILDNPENPVKYIGERFINWYNSGPKDIGNIINLALSAYAECGSWEIAAASAHGFNEGISAGNGSLMRCIPVALYYKDPDIMIKVTEGQSKLTHYDDKATRACIFYNKLVSGYLKGESKITFLKEMLSDYPEYSKVLNISKCNLKSSGYVVDSLMSALWCFINTNTFEEAVCEAVNLCGDADTVGAITGGLAGAYYGADAIPVRWSEKILVKDKLTELAQRIASQELGDGS
ncbi:MAG: ADP-ribosylglycohydrolase [Firmicutes bacterium]|nr:ADP-ribosylglycohydrolase [Bacillota bacterium]